MACEKINLFGPPEEHHIIFCPNSFSPFAKTHLPHPVSILYASLHRHSNLFTQLSSHPIFLHPLSYAFFFQLPLPTAYSLTLPPYSNLYSINSILCSNFVLLLVSLFHLPLSPPKSRKSLLHFPSLKSALPPHRCHPALSLLYSNQASSCSALPEPTRGTYKRSCLKPGSGITLKVMLPKSTTACVDRLSGEASCEAPTISQVFVKGSYFPKADNAAKIRQISILL